jgi:hypothetical protein
MVAMGHRFLVLLGLVPLGIGWALRREPIDPPSGTSELPELSPFSLCASVSLWWILS